MNTAQRNRRTHIAFFFTSLVFSVVMFLGAAYLFKLFSEGNVDGESFAAAACAEVLTAHGFLPQRAANGTLTIKRISNDRIESMISQVGVVIAYCPSHTLDTFCAGRECETPGIEFTLKERK